jgi:RNA recognition motif-containing protein
LLIYLKRQKDLEDEFGRFGNIVEIIIPLDFYSKAPKGYCFIEFEDYYQAEDAFYSLHLSTFFGEKIEIDYAKSDWKSIPFCFVIIDKC